MGLSVIRASDPKEASTMTVVVRGETYAEADSKAAKAMAEKHARDAGFQFSGLSNIPVVQPVDKNGDTTVEVATGKEPVAGYARAFQFSKSR